MLKINIVTLGCSKNTVDSEYLGGSLRKKGYSVFFDSEQENCEIVIINTCGFIGDAKEESIDTILQFSEARKAGLLKKLLVCGCLSQRYKKELEAEISNVDAFFGVHEWDDILQLLEVERSAFFQTERFLSTPKHYAYLKISEGCNRGCSFCAIPSIRGKYTSRSFDDLVKETSELVHQGTKEILLIAQDTTQYGVDLYKQQRLAELMETLAQNQSLHWLRLHYAYPQGFDERVLDVLNAYPNICNYLDMPLQHISTKILSSMRRSVDKKETYALIEKIRKKVSNLALRTTLIVGYPGETDADFQELKHFVQEAQFDRMGVFAYSPEEGTPAFRLEDNILPEIKEDRIAELMEIQQQISLEINQKKIGKTLKTIIDRKEGDFSIGRTEFDAPEVDNEVLIKDYSLTIGEFYPILIEDASEFDLFGRVNPSSSLL